MKKQAEDLLAKVKAGADFSQLATKFSEDETSRVKGGDLDFFPKGQMVPEFDKAAFALQVGEIQSTRGQLFDRALEEAGIDRTRVYVTNAVKHFKFEPRGKRRIHKKPNNNEIEACRWWLDNELHLLKPQLTVALGATAARALDRPRHHHLAFARPADAAARGRRGLHHGASLVPAAPARRGVEGAGICAFRRRPEAGGEAPAGDPQGRLTPRGCEVTRGPRR